jgi:hypothetical protein
MTIEVELYEDTGAVLSGHGTTRIAVDNIGWKDSPLDETNSFVYYPINRDTTNFGYSHAKYNYMKISGTYAAGSRPRIQISGSVIGAPPSGYTGTNAVRLYYKLTNVYSTQDPNMDGTLIYLPPGTTHTLYPAMSTVGPEAATTYPKHLTGNTTYYSQYIVTQLYVEPGAASKIGNIGEIVLKFYMDEYETADL